MPDTKNNRHTNEHVARLLHEVTLAYHRFTAAASRQRGMGVTELRALGYLRDEGALTPGSLGERLAITGASVTALVDRLETGGYAHRVPHSHDRRSLLVELTPSGRLEVGTLFELLASDVNAAVEGMAPVEQDAVVRFLGAMIDCFEQRTTVIPAGDGSSLRLDGKP